MIVATVAPNGVVFGIDGFGGSNVRLRTGGGTGFGGVGGDALDVNSTST